MADGFTVLMARLDDIEARQAKASLGIALEEALFAASRLKATGSDERTRAYYGNLQERLEELAMQTKAEGV